MHIILICLKTQDDFISIINSPRRKSSLSSHWLVQGQWRTRPQVQTTLRTTQHYQVGDLPASLTTRQACSSCISINTAICHRLHIHWDFSSCCFWLQWNWEDSTYTGAFTRKNTNRVIQIVSGLEFVCPLKSLRRNCQSGKSLPVSNFMELVMFYWFLWRSLHFIKYPEIGNR